ncbi:MAG TPA: hypothetical protein PKE04_12175, partial [Clostridia bacterium]|nr:hypothetical protein [Clostridia bacterium]
AEDADLAAVRVVDRLHGLTVDDVLDHLLPPIQRTPAEDEEFTRIMADVRTHIQESAQKFMLGTMSLDDFETYINQMKSLKVERAVEIMQAAYDRYMAK